MARRVLRVGVGGILSSEVDGSTVSTFERRATVALRALLGVGSELPVAQRLAAGLAACGVFAAGFFAAGFFAAGFFAAGFCLTADFVEADLDARLVAMNSASSSDEGEEAS